MENMKKRDFFIIGTALGAAIGYLANSDRGRKMTAEMKEELTVKAEALKEQGTDLAHMATEKVSDMQDKGSGLLAEASDKLAELRLKGNSYLRKMGRTPVSQRDIEKYIDGEVKDLKLKLLEKVEAKTEQIADAANSRKKAAQAN